MPFSWAESPYRQFAGLPASFRLLSQPIFVFIMNRISFLRQANLRHFLSTGPIASAELFVLSSLVSIIWASGHLLLWYSAFISRVSRIGMLDVCCSLFGISTSFNYLSASVCVKNAFSVFMSSDTFSGGVVEYLSRFYEVFKGVSTEMPVFGF